MPRDVLDSLALSVAAPLDAARAQILQRFGRTLAPLFRDRAARTTLVASASVLVCFTLSVGAPIAVLALGPILLGVPHLVADMRYLVVRRGLHHRRGAALVLPGLLVLSMVVPTIELAGLGTFVASAVARGTRPRRALICVGGIGLFVFGVTHGRAADVVFAHLHNVLAIVIWWSIRPRVRALEWVTPGLVAALALVLVVMPLPHSFHVLAGSLSLGGLVQTLAPFDTPDAALRFVLLFAFGQSVHYAIWLRAVPEDARPRSAPRTHAASFRALREELGALPIVAAASIALALAALSLVDLAGARDAYLRLALFHGPLEVALLGLAFAEARRP